MTCYIGEDYLDITTNEIVHVQDTDFVNQQALVGVSDGNGIVWDTYWIPWRLLELLPTQ